MPPSRPLRNMPVVVNPRTVYHTRPEILENHRGQLVSEYFSDLHEAWRAKGRAVLDTVAMLYPEIFLRVVASHMPRQVDAVVTNIKVDRLTNVELDALIEQEIRATAREEETQEDPALLR